MYIKVFTTLSPYPPVSLKFVVHLGQLSVNIYTIYKDDYEKNAMFFVRFVAMKIAVS